MIFAVFHDYPGLEYGLPKFPDFPWLSRPSGHPADKINRKQSRAYRHQQAAVFPTCADTAQCENQQNNDAPGNNK